MTTTDEQATAPAEPIDDSAAAEEQLRVTAFRELAEKRRAIAERESEREAQDLRETLESFIAMAERHTGMTREELLAEAAKPPPEPPPAEPPAPLAPRESRRAVLERGVPELHLRHVYDQLPAKCEALEVVAEFVDEPTRWALVLSGGVGTRKTGSACWALTQTAGVYVAADELSRLAGARDEDGQLEYRRIRKASILVIDDLGGEYLDDKGWFVRTFGALMDARYSRCLKTIITTNLTAPQFKANYGERVADRIREAGRWRDIRGSSVRPELRRAAGAGDERKA